MKNKEFQRRLVYDTLILLGVFTVILFMCRLWPLILLCILGLFAAMIRLLFLSRKETVIIQSVPQEPAKAETEKDLQQLAFELAIRRITERVTDDFPQARWVWKSQHAKEDTSSHIGHIENARGIPSLEMTVNIANALSVSVDQLLIESMDWPETIYLRDIESRLRKFPAPLKEVACELLDDFMHLLERSLLREVINSEHHQWPAKRDKHGF